MRELHVVATSEDGRHVVLAARRGSSKGAFKLALDATLAAALRGDLPRPGDEEVPELSPKEIQARLRTGESVEQIARSAGVPLARVERYAGPVQGEMARMIDAARSAYVVRGRLGRSAVDLGTAVDAALTAAGADEESAWSTFRRDDGQWLVTVRWYARKRSRTASWAYDPAQRVVTATDPASAALAHQESEESLVRRKPAAPSTPAAARAKKAPAKKAPAKKAAAKKAAAKKATKAPVKKGATKATVKKAAATKAPVKKAAAKRAPAKKAAATKAPAKKAPARKAPAKRATRAAAVAVPARRAPVRLRVVPDPEPRTAQPSRARAKSPAKQRASVPAWADVLLGTSPGGER